MKRYTKPRRYTVTAIIILIFIISYTLVRPVNTADKIDTPHADVYFLDVGQSDSTLIVSGKDAILVDGGTRSMGKTVVNSLKEIGIKRLTAIIATHPHQDHIGGLPAVLKEFPTDTIYMSDGIVKTKTFRRFQNAVKKFGVNIVYPDIGNMIYLDGDVSLKCISPGLNAMKRYKDGYVNTWSLVYRMEAYSHSVLLTGDTTKAAEHDMLKRGENLKCDVLKVAHHGDDTSTTQPFVNAAAPKYGVISYGADNIYGVPKKSVKRTLKRNKIVILTTPKYGTIKLEITQNHLKFTGTKNVSKKIID